MRSMLSLLNIKMKRHIYLEHVNLSFRDSMEASEFINKQSLFFEWSLVEKMKYGMQDIFLYY